MAENKVTKDSVSEKDPFGNIRKSAEETTPEILALQKALDALKESAKATKKSAKIVDPKDVKSIDELNKLTERSNNLSKAKLQIDEALIKEKLKLQEANKNRNKNLKAEIALEDKEAGTLQKLAAANTKLRQERDKLNLETKKGQTRLKQINKELDRNNKVIERNSDKLKQQKIGIGRYGKALGGLRSSLLKLGAAFGVGFGVQQLRSFATASVDAFREQQKAIAQVEAGLKSTGNQVGITSEKLQQMASDLQGKTLFGDEEILKDATAQLLTFTNIAGDNFGRTQEAVLDLATRLDGDLKSASIQLGKALNDPVANLSALSRSGIQFSQSQKDVIKALTESGKLAEAQTIILDELNKQYGGSAEAAAEADGGLTQLSNSIGDAKEQFGKIILEGLKPTIKSLKEFFENLKEEDIRSFINVLKNIGKVILTLVKGFVAFKTVMFAINMTERVKDFREFGKAAKQSGEGLTAAGEGAQKFGKALKGIAIAALVTALYETAQAFWAIYSGANAAAEAVKVYNLASDEGKQRAETFLENQRKIIEKSKDEEKAVGLATAAINNRIKILTQERNASRNAANALQDHIDGFTDLERANLTLNGQLEIYTGQLNMLRGQEQLRQSEIDGLTTGIGTLTQEQETANEIQLESIAGTTKEIDNTKLLLDLYRDMIGVLAKKNDVERDAIDTTALEAAQFAAEERAIAELHYLIILKEIAIEEAKRNGNTQEAIRLEAELIDLKKKRIDAEVDLAKKQTDSGAEKQTLQAQADLDKLLLDNKEEALKEGFELDKQYIDLAEAYFIASADKKIKKLDEEIKAHEKQADLLQQLAANGNIQAQESLAAEQQAIAEANAQKEQEEKRKQQILAVSAFLQAYTSNLAAGDDSATAFTKAATTQAVVDQFIGSLVGFHDGTEDTGSAGVFADEHGVITGYTHKNERVITAADNAKMAGYSNAEVTRIVENHRLGEYAGGVQLGNGWEQQQLVNQLMDVKQGLAEVNETIKNRPVSNLEIGNVLATYMTFSQKVTTGNDKVTYKYKIK